MKQLCGVEMEQTQRSKLLWKLPPVDNCDHHGVQCAMPIAALPMPGGLGLDDPTGKEDRFFIEVIRGMEEKVFPLKNRVEN